jgi:hypothetical protein
VAVDVAVASLSDVVAMALVVVVVALVMVVVVALVVVVVAEAGVVEEVDGIGMQSVYSQLLSQESHLINTLS